MTAVFKDQRFLYQGSFLRTAVFKDGRFKDRRFLTPIVFKERRF